MEEFQELCHDVMDLLVNVGLMSSVMPSYPEDVQENFEQRISQMRAWVQRQTAEVQSFGEAYDEGV